MTLCPIALMAGCRSCPAVQICPLKTVLGDYKLDDKSEPPKQDDNRGH